MFKSQVPFCFCSLALIMVPPPSANSGQTTVELSKNVAYTVTRSKSIPSKKSKFSVMLPDKQGMKFVNHYIKNNDECLLTVKKRSEIPFTIIDSVLTRYGLPLELKYLAVIESELKPSALSRVGARGPWQLMPETAHVLGLKVNHRSDERINYYKSTRAAAKYLKDLHREFGDWLLVLAAYNGGPVPVYRAIHKAHSRNFWTLQNYLPAESRQHVKKFIATAYYFEGSDSMAKPKPAITTAPLYVEAQTQARIQTQIQIQAQTQPKQRTESESTDEKFKRLMRESANSLKTSRELLSM